MINKAAQKSLRSKTSLFVNDPKLLFFTIRSAKKHSALTVSTLADLFRNSLNYDNDIYYVDLCKKLSNISNAWVDLSFHLHTCQYFGLQSISCGDPRISVEFPMLNPKICYSAEEANSKCRRFSRIRDYLGLWVSSSSRNEEMKPKYWAFTSG